MNLYRNYLANPQSTGYRRLCVFCGREIYMKLDFGTHWRAYESWAAGNAEPGSWTQHKCRG